MFPTYLSGMPFDRDIYFCIDKEHDTRPIFIPPCRVPRMELRELMSQIQELLVKLDEVCSHSGCRPVGL